MPKLLFLLAATALATAGFSAAAQDAATTPPPAVAAAKPADYAIIEVNGEKIQFSEVEGIWNSMFPPGQPHPQFESFDEKIKQNLLRGIISEHLLVKEAKTAGLDKREDVKRLMEMAANRVLLQMVVEEKTKGKITDEALKAAYDKKVKELKTKEEFHAAHILVSTEDEAKALAKEIKDGAEFSALAKEKSNDKASGALGGDLGYFMPERMVPEFSKAVQALKKGQVSNPVKSPFGWHIIKLVDRRPMAAPAFDAKMQGEIKDELTKQTMNDYIEGILAKAKIEYFGADGKAKAFNKDFRKN